MTASTYKFYCPHCGKETEAGRGWQAFAIFAPKNGMRPRTYELCSECTELLHRFLEGEQ